MSIKKANEIFGYSLFIVGASKLLLLIIVLLKFITNLSAIFNGGYVDDNYYITFSGIIGLSQIILAVGSIIMIILNKKKQPGVISGYLMGLGAIAIEFIVPSLLMIFFVFLECGMYMRAGSKIINKNLGYDKDYKKAKRDMKNTEWFYEEK